MEFALRGIKEAQTIIAAANNPEIRYFTVEQRSAYHPAAVPVGNWKVVSRRQRIASPPWPMSSPPAFKRRSTYPSA